MKWVNSKPEKVKKVKAWAIILGDGTSKGDMLLISTYKRSSILVKHIHWQAKQIPVTITYTLNN